MSSKKDSGSSSFVVSDNPLLNSDYVGTNLNSASPGSSPPTSSRRISQKIAPMPPPSSPFHADTQKHQFNNSVDEESNKSNESTRATRASMEVEAPEKLRLSQELDPNEPINIWDSYKGSWIPDRQTTVVIKKGSRMTRRMWTKDFIGLYAHYAGVGLQGAISGLSMNFCVYYFKEKPNICSNAGSIMFIPWSFKLLYAIVTDSWRPMGLRRKPFMIAGWIGVLFFTLLLACTMEVINAKTWLVFSILSNACLMLADVPADGYSVEMGQYEAEDERGMILSTGQRIRFAFSVAGSFIQTFLVNGPQTNAPDCPISFATCWRWGLSPNGYYGLMFALTCILFIPILYMKEPDPTDIPLHTIKHHRDDLWKTLQSRTTFYLLIFVTGTNIFSSLGSQASTYLQYYVIGLTNFQSGIDNITTSLATVGAVMIFQTFFLKKNWRVTQYLSTLTTSCLGLLWLLAYYDVRGLLNGWYTIFINISQSFASGISQVLFAMAVIELATPGQEAITYELVISTGNAAGTVNGIISTQLLTPFDAIGCSFPPCPPDTVAIYPSPNNEAYMDSHGPERFANYTYVVLAINIVACLLFTRFLPVQKYMCAEWKKQGEESGLNRPSGYASMTIAMVIMIYGILSTFMILSPSTSCLPAFGGKGC